MNTHADKASKNKGQVIANGLAKSQSESKSPFQLADNRPEAVAQRKLQELADNSQQVSRLRALQQLANASPHVSQLKSLQKLANNSPQLKQAAQLQALSSAKAPSPIQQEIANGIAQLAQVPEEGELIQGKFETVQLQQNQSDSKPRHNNTGLPDKLKAGIESLSGMSLDHVKVHYNSSQPAQLNALAYAQGSDIHVAPGQEQHLPHEAWHIVQQAQGRVQPTMQMKDGVAINDDAGLEREADVMGGRAVANATQRQELEESVAQPELADAVNHSQRLIAQQASIRSVLSSPWVIAQAKRLDGMFGATQLRPDPVDVSYFSVRGCHPWQATPCSSPDCAAMANPLPARPQGPAETGTATRGAAADQAKGRDSLQQHALRDTLRPTLEARALGMGRPSRSATVGGVLQRLEDGDVASKQDKKTLAGIKAKFNKTLGYRGTHYHYSEESFGYYFEKANSLADLTTRVDAAIVRALNRASAVPSSAAAAPAPAPAPASSSPSSSSAPAKQDEKKEEKKEKKKEKKVPKVNLAALYFSGAPAYVQQPSIDVRGTTNPQIQAWIAAKPLGASVAYNGTFVSDDTVYIYATVTLSTVELLIPTHYIEIHYHPVPNTANYLHVKRSKGADAGNIATKDCWLIPGGAATLADADKAWDAANPLKLSKTPWK